MSLFMTASISPSVMFSKLLPLVKYCLIKPLVFSFKPRSQEQYGWAKYTLALSCSFMDSCPANSLQLSAVIVKVLYRWGYSNIIMAALVCPDILIDGFMNYDLILLKAL